MAVYGYLRVSTTGQGESGLGLAAQRAAVEAWAAARDVPCELVEEVGSGNGSQPVLQDLRGRLERGDVLVVAKLDRLGRSTRKVLDVAESLERAGVDLVALDLGVDTTTPAGRLVLTVLAALAEWERAIISERTRAALAVKSAAGQLQRAERGTSPAALERIRDLREDGLPMQVVCDILTAEGVPTAQGCEWRPGTLHYLIRKHGL